jgi:DNA primase
VARIKDQSVRDVIAASNIVDVVGLRTSLRKSSGTRFMGRCPFHEEKSPSFSVNADLNLYHCFGCGKGGDVVTFVRETEGLDFVGAIEWLAERFRVTLEYEESSPQADETRRRRERLYAVLEQATAFFERHLWDGADGEPVRAYLAGRGLGEAIAREFRLGLAPGVGLARKAREKGFTAEELRAAGLTNQRGNDYFPQRLMFPLADARGRVIGFQARKLHEDDPLRGKYVNSPESDLFKKSHILYGLHLARPSIAKQDRAVVVEGNTDVIALRQSGFEAVVASMGTSLTEQHLHELGRLTKRLFLCFDSDAAGEEATLRGMERAHGQGFEIRVVTLPPGQDPADAPDGFEQRLGGAESYLHYRVRLELDRAADRQEAFVRAREVLSRAEDSPERQEALRLVADRLDLPRETLSGIAPARGAGGVPVPAAQPTQPQRLLDAGIRLEREALAAVVAHPDLHDALAGLGEEHFDLEEHRRMRAALVARAQPDPDLVPLLAELDAIASSEGITRRTGTEMLLRLRERKLRRDLQGETDLARATELQAHLAKVRLALIELA